MNSEISMLVIGFGVSALVALLVIGAVIIEDATRGLK